MALSNSQQKPQKQTICLLQTESKKSGPNALLVRSGEEVPLAHPFGRVERLGIVFTGVGFQPHPDAAFPAEGGVRLRYADGFEQEWVWDVRDSNGAGRGDVAQVASTGWTLVRTSDGARWGERSLFWQDLQADGGRELVEVCKVEVGAGSSCSNCRL